MKRRELFRRSIMGTVGAALVSVRKPQAEAKMAATEPVRHFPQGYDASEALQASDWQPEFLSAHQNETLIQLSDLIIPETDTPGARSALVNRFIDHLLAVEDREIQKAFLESLAYIDGEARRRFKKAFLHLEEKDQKDILTFLAHPHNLVTWGSNRSEFAGHQHFLHLRSWISRAYYSSEAGMRELGWDGAPFHGPFQGCDHPEGTHE